MTTLEGDLEPLFGSQHRRTCSGRCWVLTALITAVSVGLLLAGYNYYWKDVVSVRVMSYNTWGMPAAFGSFDKEERMVKIGEMLANGDYDIVMLEELWTRADHTTISNAVSGQYHMTSYDDFNDVDGSCVLCPAPAGCSGLAIISRYPIKETNFTKFTSQGSLSHLFSDGEYLAAKGIGSVKVVPREGVTVDVFVTHTISEDSNYAIREQQADQIIDLIDNSKADFVILGGDFNASPLMELDKTYHKVKKVMTDAFQEIMANINAWLKDEFATYANPRNTYTGGREDLKPVIYDYIFHKKKTPDIGLIWAKWFYLPLLKTINSFNNNTISLSDHEPVTSHLYLWKQQQ